LWHRGASMIWPQLHAIRAVVTVNASGFRMKQS